MQTLDAKINAQRAQLAARRTELPAMLARCDADLELADAMAQQRSGIRRAALLRLDVAKRRAQCAEIASDRPQRRFEQRVLPFLLAQQRMQSERGDEADGAGVRRLPGGRKRRRVVGIPAWSQQTSADGTIVKEYMAEFEGVPCETPAEPDDVCSLCGGRLLLLERKGRLCCERCGSSIAHLDMSKCSQAQRGEVEFVSQSYKRSNHFLEWLNQLQAKESTLVSPAVLEAVMAKLYDGNCRRSADVTVPRVRAALKALRKRTMYEHVCQIACRINGSMPPRLQPRLEEQLRLMFLAVQQPFERVKGRRKNFLSYSYTLQQFLRLLGVDVTQVPNMSFTLLKGRDKLHRQNVIFERLCATPELRWEYRPIMHQP